MANNNVDKQLRGIMNRTMAACVILACFVAVNQKGKFFNLLFGIYRGPTYSVWRCSDNDRQIERIQMKKNQAFLLRNKK